MRTANYQFLGIRYYITQDSAIYIGEVPVAHFKRVGASFYVRMRPRKWYPVLRGMLLVHDLKWFCESYIADMLAQGDEHSRIMECQDDPFDELPV